MVDGYREGGSMPAGGVPIVVQTGHRDIDREHAELFAALERARTICLDTQAFSSCATCSPACRSACERDLIDVLGTLLGFVLDHFKSEESIMRDSLLMMIDRDLCLMHMEDHAAISSLVERLVGGLDATPTVLLLRDLDSLLGGWMAQHIATHDVALVNWVEREDSALRSRF